MTRVKGSIIERTPRSQYYGVWVYSSYTAAAVDQHRAVRRAGLVGIQPVQPGRDLDHVVDTDFFRLSGVVDLVDLRRSVDDYRVFHLHPGRQHRRRAVQCADVRKNRGIIDRPTTVFRDRFHANGGRRNRLATAQAGLHSAVGAGAAAGQPDPGNQFYRAGAVGGVRLVAAVARILRLPDGQPRPDLRRAKKPTAGAPRHRARLRRRGDDHDQHPDRQLFRDAGRGRNRHAAVGRTVPGHAFDRIVAPPIPLDRGLANTAAADEPRRPCLDL